MLKAFFQLGVNRENNNLEEPPPSETTHSDEWLRSAVLVHHKEDPSWCLVLPDPMHSERSLLVRYFGTSFNYLPIFEMTHVLASKIGRSGRIRTPDHWFWCLMAPVLPHPARYVSVQIFSRQFKEFLFVVISRHVWSPLVR